MAYQGIMIVKKRGEPRCARYFEPLAQVDFHSAVEDGRTLANERILANRWLDKPLDLDEAEALAREMEDALPGYRKRMK